jgi:hypothetical protein
MTRICGNIKELGSIHARQDESEHNARHKNVPQQKFIIKYYIVSAGYKTMKA